MVDNTGTIDFTELFDFGNLRPRPALHSTNVIKAERVTTRGSRQVEVPDGGQDQPSVVIHRDGDVVQSVEFVCTCGRTASLRIQYEGE